MAYIYKITNMVNGKSYIGKTERSIQERFREHKKLRNNRKHEKRPLYTAMNKYGVKNFKLELLEKTVKSFSLNLLLILINSNVFIFESVLYENVLSSPPILLIFENLL